MISKIKSGIVLIAMVLLTAAWAWAEPVSLETAETAAQNWINARTAGQGETYKRSDVFTVNEKSEPACYVFNFTPNGWVIISADDAARPVIAYSLEGAYSPENHPPAFDAWMDVVKQAISNLPIKKALPSPETTDEWMRLMDDTEGLSPKTRSAAAKSVAPLIQTAWDQDMPYNAQCPLDDLGPGGRAVTGCVATAMAQIMKYHAYPETGYGSHSYVPEYHPEYGTLFADFGSATYDFSKMPNTTAEYDTQAEIDEIARLFFHCGVAVEMEFGPFDSGANMENDARNALKNYFRFEESLYAVRKDNYLDEEQWKSLLKAELDALRPLLYAGRSATGAGHSFICDGYDDVDFFHFNWGWEGNLNGYFRLDDLTPDDNYDYTLDQNAVIHIRPAETPQLTFPYTQGFENGPPAEWIFSGERAKIISGEAHAGDHAVMISDPAFTGFEDFAGGNVNIAALKINVPAVGGVLSFWVKRENNNSGNPSPFNKQIAQIRSQFGPEPLLEIFNGDYNDDDWQNFTVNLTDWAGTVVTLYFEVDKAFTTDGEGNPLPTYQWMMIDDVKIIANDAPVSDFSAQPTQTCAGTPVQFTDQSTFFPTTWSWSFPGGSPSTSTEQNPVVTYDVPGIYSVTLTTGNGLGTGTTKTKNSSMDIYTVPMAQCEPVTQDLSNPLFYFGIYNVTFNGINNTTGGSVEDNGYKDFSCTQIANLFPDADFSISVTVGRIGKPLNEEYIKVFIDYNNDGDFSDAGELVFSSDSAPGVHTGVIHTPQHPIMDTLLRMRVMSDFNPLGNACSNPTYGQAEDYGVVFDSGIIPGDLNGDKTVDLADAVVALRIAAGIVPVNGVNLEADVNGDDKIGMPEVVYILQKVAGLRAD